MKTKTVIAVLLMIIILTSCAPTAAPIPATFTAVPTPTAIPPTEQPHLLLQQDTILYSGPGNIGFDTIAILKAGEAVYPLGAYVDFVQVVAKINGTDVNGFISKNDLGNLPGNFPELSADSVPWKPFFLPQCSSGNYDAKTDILTFENPGTDFYELRSKAIPLEAPLHIRVDGMKVTGDSFGSIKILGMPGGQNPWWKGITLMDFGIKDGQYVFFVLDGTRQYNNFSISDLGLSTSETIQVVFEQIEGKSFVILDGNNRQIRRIDLTQEPELKLPDGLFPEGKVYIGTILSPNSSLSVSGLRIGSLAKGQWLNNTSVYPGLAELAVTHNLSIGTEFSMNENMDPRFCRAMHRDFNLAVLNSLYSSWYWRGPGQYYFSDADRDLNYVLEQGWKVRGNIVYGQEATGIPDWLKNGNFTRDQYIQILEDFVKTVVGRYKGRVSEWSIANEAIGRSFYPGDFWNEKIGPEYIEMAFRWAREADPNAILIFNESNNESPRDSETQRVVTKMYNTVKDLKEKGVPIDGVGMQMHLLLKYGSPIAPNKEDVLVTMRKFADLGVKIYITEFDVDLHKHPGTPEQRLQYEADLYKAMLEACLESNACGSFSTWGIADATSWITQICSDSWCINHPDGDPLMFDNDYNPKPAYFAVRDVLLNFSMPSSP